MQCSKRIVMSISEVVAAIFGEIDRSTDHPPGGSHDACLCTFVLPAKANTGIEAALWNKQMSPHLGIEVVTRGNEFKVELEWTDQKLAGLPIEANRGIGNDD